MIERVEPMLILEDAAEDALIVTEEDWWRMSDVVALSSCIGPQSHLRKADRHAA